MKGLQSLVFVAFVLTTVRSQFRLPSPPRVLFGGFRPISSNLLPPPPPSSRPSRLPLQFQEQQNFIVPIPASDGQRQSFNGLRDQFLPPPFQAFNRPVSQLVQQADQISPGARPFSPLIQIPQEAVTFGTPKPDSIIVSVPSSVIGPSAPPPTFPLPLQTLQSGFQRPSPPVVVNQRPRRPFSAILSSNNIIGMTPPPPPLSLFPIAQPFFTTPSPVSSVALSPVIPPVSNSLEDLVINPVPPVNAGVLPLANERPEQLQIFPPFTNS